MTTIDELHGKWTTVLLPDIAWQDDTWPDYLSVAHEINGKWRAYVPELTLERETCKGVAINCYDGLLPPFTVHCSECNDEWGFTPNYCPNCGRKVVYE